MQKRDMAGIDLTFQVLQVVAVLKALVHVHMAGRDPGPFKSREVGDRAGAGAQVGPDDATSLYAGIGSVLNLVLKGGLGRLVGHIQTAPGDIVLPTVINAPQPLLLV